MSTRRITLERTYDATLDDVWELWTTRDGIEAWWGPDGFSVTVDTLELRPGGTLFYTMTAVAPEQVAFLTRSNMPLSSSLRVTYTRVERPHRLAFESLADFIPGVAPYRVETDVELVAVGDRVKVILTIDAMHEARWTELAVEGWRQELGRLDVALARRR